MYHYTGMYLNVCILRFIETVTNKSESKQGALRRVFEPYFNKRLEPLYR